MATLSQGMGAPKADNGQDAGNGNTGSPSSDAPPEFSDPNSSPEATHQSSLSKGYSDGFVTARIFSLYGLSKLGFIGQYIADSLAMLGTAIPPGTEDAYRSGFVQGLADGETAVAASLGA